MDSKQLEILIEKYVNGNCDAAELDRLLEFIRDYPQDERIQNLIQSHWDDIPLEIPADKLKQAYQKTDLTLASIWREQDKSSRWRIGSKVKFTWAAASIVLLISFGTWFWKRGATTEPSSTALVYLSYEPNTLSLPDGKTVELNSNKTDQVLWEDEATKIIQVSVDEIQLIDKLQVWEDKEDLLLTVAKGKKVRVRFSDGTTAWVNADSQLKFPSQFGPSKRLVSLVGEAYFEVSHAAQRPFYVKGEEQLIQVYGTRFNVRSYKTESKNSTTLYEGRLSVRRKLNKDYQDEKMLHPGDRYELHKTSERADLVSIAKDQKTVDWTSDRIYYNSASLKEIFMDLSHQYLIDVDWNNIPDLRFQGYLPQGQEQDLDHILEVLGRTSNISIKRTNNKISF